MQVTLVEKLQLKILNFQREDYGYFMHNQTKVFRVLVMIGHEESIKNYVFSFFEKLNTKRIKKNKKKMSYDNNLNTSSAF